MTQRSSGKSQTAENSKDFWRTWGGAIKDAENLLGMRMALDACATDVNVAVAGEFISPDKDALKVDWTPFGAFGAVWCNPPFSLKSEFLARAHDQAVKNKLTVCCMIPFEIATGWWSELVQNKATFVFMPDGRYPFIHPETNELMRSPDFATCFVVYTPFNVPTQYIPFKRSKPPSLRKAQ